MSVVLLLAAALPAAAGRLGDLFNDSTGGRDDVSQWLASRPVFCRCRSASPTRRSATASVSLRPSFTTPTGSVRQATIPTSCWDLVPRWNLVGIGGVGWTADALSERGSESGITAGGVGFRLLVLRYELQVGRDVGR